MIDRWYVVKRNWPQIEAAAVHYAGVGGDVWPLDNADDEAAKQIHRRMLASRKHVATGSIHELVCIEREMADVYWRAVCSSLGDGWLLEVTTEHTPTDEIAGIDLGFPSGGFSVVETELIVQGLPGPSLNRWGLVDTALEAEKYMVARQSNDELEQVDGVEPLYIRVIASGR